MGSRTLAALAAALLVALASSASAVELMVYKVSVKVVAKMVVSGTGGAPDRVLVMKLGNNEFINLGLGRPLGTKIDAKTEMLAGAGDFEQQMSSSPVSKLIVLDPTANGVAQEKVVVAKATTLDYQGAFFNKGDQGAGIGTATILDTGDAMNGFVATDVCGSAEGTGGHLGFDQNTNMLVFPAIAGKGTMSGPIKFNFTDKNGMTTHFDGFIVAAQGKVSGKPISSFTE